MESEFGYVKIPLEMLEGLCHDANWKIEGINDTKVRIFNRYFGGDYLIEKPNIKSSEVKRE